MNSPKPGKKRLLSGIKPTGRIHIGNYFGALKQFVDLQDEYETFVMVANLHALTGLPDKQTLLIDTKELILDYLGAGLDPKKIVLFKQSDVPAHANLAWIFNNLVTMPYLMRGHAFKSKISREELTKEDKEYLTVLSSLESPGDYDPIAGQWKNDQELHYQHVIRSLSNINVGIFTYPVLMASDILLYSTDVVPVGRDQKQHIEYSRDIAKSFNYHYKEEVFKLPNELIIESVQIVPGTDGQKMSKSYNNTIPFFGTDSEIRNAVMSIKTDSKGKDEEKNPDDMVLYQIHKLFNPSAELRTSYCKGLGYGDAKKMLIEDIITFVTPMRERRKKYEDDPELVRQILLEGAMKANEIAMKKLTEVYEAVGLTE